MSTSSGTTQGGTTHDEAPAPGERQALNRRLKEIIVDCLNLDGKDPASIGDDEALFGDGLGLDSVDALELVVALEKEYGIKIRSDEIDPQAFANVDSLGRFVAARRAADAEAAPGSAGGAAG